MASFSLGCSCSLCAGIFKRRTKGENGTVTAPHNAESTVPPAQPTYPQPPAYADQSAHPQNQASLLADLHAGHGELPAVADGGHTNLMSRGSPVDPKKIVRQSLNLPHFSSSKVQDVLEYWHVEAAMYLFDPFNTQELFSSYLTTLEWATQLFLPDLEGRMREYTSALLSTVMDVDVCSKRLLYLSGVPVVTSRGSPSSDIEMRKTKALHTLGVFFIIKGKLTQVSTLVRESSKLFCTEIGKDRNFSTPVVKILMSFTRLSRYSLDALEYLQEYYSELRMAIMASLVYPLLVTRTYTRLHRSLQTAGQYFSTCVHARKIGASLQHDIAELRGMNVPPS
ncbi:uncharacterized protein LOC34617889 [Cyclospora cayetanensis]|uniref:Uncharacterized protein LOC34617889 n=1 Tax=Cyclospora cayetanensis TaxID=88456 RepID=A0A6P6RUL4_9EIME|nr:uncharacterized protein LOC34617889 [Cyclospora cayetanensis]